MDISKIKTNSLDNATHHQFGTDIDSRCKTMLPADDAGLAKVSDLLSTCVEREGNSYKMVRKSELSQQKAGIDHRRADVLTAMDNSIHVAKLRNEPELQAAAQRLQILFDTYNSPKPMARLSYDGETTAIARLLDELNSKYADDMRLTGLDIWANELATLNAEFVRVSSTMVSAAATRPDYTHREARQATDEAWRKLCTVLEAAMITGDEEKYKPFAAEINAVVKHYADNLAIHKGRTGSKQATNGEATEEEKSENQELNAGA